MNTHLFEELVILHNRICSALGDPKRLLILYSLSEHSYNVNELALEIETPQSTVSHHLRVLRERSLVKTERDGATVFYSLADPRIIQALDLLRDVLHDVTRQQASLADFNALGAEGEHEADQ